MANYYQKRNSSKMLLIQLGIFLGVIILIYGGDLLLYSIFDGSPMGLLAYSELSTFAMLFLCVMTIVVFYFIDLAKKIKEKRVPKNF